MKETELSIEVNSNLLAQVQPILDSAGLTAEEAVQKFIEYVVQNHLPLEIITEAQAQNSYWAAVKNAPPLDKAVQLTRELFCDRPGAALELTSMGGQPVVITDGDRKYALLELKEAHSAAEKA